MQKRLLKKRIGNGYEEICVFADDRGSYRFHLGKFASGCNAFIGGEPVGTGFGAIDVFGDSWDFSCHDV